MALTLTLTLTKIRNMLKNKTLTSVEKMKKYHQQAKKPKP